MFVTNEEQVNIFKYISTLDVCDKCILRYLGYKINEQEKCTFVNPGGIFNKLFNIKDADCSDPKKVKKNQCRSCLNILDADSIDNHSSYNSDEFKKYKINDFYITLNFPASIQIRDYAMFLHLKEKFPDVYKDFNDIEKIKKVFRILLSQTFSEVLKIPFKHDSNLNLNVTINYDDERKETEDISKLTSNKNSSKKKIDDFLNTLCSDEEFKKRFSVPPTIPVKETNVTISFSSSIVYLGGRYFKFSREMGQTPFIVNNVAITECSVQEVIFNSVAETLGCDKQRLKFSSSGREDADVRMLGNGRPFYIQIDEPLFDKVTPEQCRKIEEGIAQSNTVVVTKLQQVSQNATKRIKFGEQEKRKHYQSLCKTLAPNTEEIINKINALAVPISLEQSTPIRVLHRRTHLGRHKKIFKINASPVTGYSNLFYLDVISDAGTYIKEFVNGDFHRTNPNLCKLTGYPVDIVALDVTAIELDWPLDL